MAFINVCIRNVVSVSEISAVNLIVRFCLFACSMNCIIPLFMVQGENNYVVYIAFQTSGLSAFWCKISVSTV